MADAASEAELIRRAKSGDFEAFDALVSAHERQVYVLAARILANRHDAEEVAQQTFLSAIEHLGEFREESRLGAWLGRIATNHALALLRKRSRRRWVPLEEDRLAGEELPHPHFIAQWRETPEQIASRRETRRLVDDALTELDEKYRLVFVLRDVEGFSTAETAEALGITESNVKVRLLRARLMLRETLTRHFGDEQARVVPGHAH